MIQFYHIVELPRSTVRKDKHIREDRKLVYRLPNDEVVDVEDITMAMENGSWEHYYFLDTETGKVELITEDMANHEELLEKMESDRYVAINNIPSYTKYEWMEDFVKTKIEKEDKNLAEKFWIALDGKGAFRRFKNVLHIAGDKWVKAWYKWKEDRLLHELDEWLENLPIKIVR